MPSLPVAGIASPLLFLGFAFKKKKLIQSVDTATTRCGYRDGKAWIQRRQGADTETTRRGYKDDKAWL